MPTLCGSWDLVGSALRLGEGTFGLWNVASLVRTSRPLHYSRSSWTLNVRVCVKVFHTRDVYQIDASETPGHRGASLWSGYLCRRLEKTIDESSLQRLHSQSILNRYNHLCYLFYPRDEFPNVFFSTPPSSAFSCTLAYNPSTYSCPLGQRLLIVLFNILWLQ